ncbi:HEAT repeat-containing protein 6, partial [Rhizoclosmatium hyalinum]
NVRAVSCFVGGVYISEHDYLRKDLAFMEALGEALVSVREDGDVTVRVRGVWAVANLGDALVAGVVEGEGVGLSKRVVKGLVGCAVFGAGDHEKCRGNGVRALGNFFRVAEKDCFSEGLVKEVDLIVRNLNAGPFKTRWNAGYAAFNLFLSPLFLDLHDIMPTLPVLFDALSTAMTASKNFKVRINSAMALGACSDVTMYRGKVMDLIRVVRVAQESVDDLGGTDFGEYKYKAQLTSQLGKTLRHLTRLSGLTDEGEFDENSKAVK